MVQGGVPTMLRNNERSGEAGQKGNSSFSMSVHLKGLFHLLQQSENLSALSASFYMSPFTFICNKYIYLFVRQINIWH